MSHPTVPYYLWNHWYIAARSSRVKANEATAITIMERRILLFRDDQGAVVALADRCPHLGAALSLGSVSGGQVACPFHGWKFDSEGSCVDIPALASSRERLSALRIHTYCSSTLRPSGLVRLASGPICSVSLREP